MFHKRCFVYLCYDFPIIDILCFTSVVLYICVMISLLLLFYALQELFCISVFCFPYYWYFMYHKRCFVYLCYDFPIIGILCLHKGCFVYLCYAFLIIGILCFTSVVLYICVMISIIDILSQLLWFSHNWYFMFHKRCFVYLCYDFPILCILCLTSVVLYICVLLSLLLIFYVSQGLFCISLLWFPYNWYFMFYKRCFVYLCSAFPIIGILCMTSFVLYIFVMISLLLVFYVSQALFCISVLWFPYNWYFMSHKRCFVYLCYDFPIIDILCFTSVVLYICVMISLLLVFYALQELFCISVFCFPYYWYFIYHKRGFVYLCYEFPIINILCFTSIVLYICVLLSL